MSPVNHRGLHQGLKREEDQADRKRGGNTTLGNVQAWSSQSPRGQWRRQKNGRNWLRSQVICGAPTTPRGRGGGEGEAEILIHSLLLEQSSIVLPTFGFNHTWQNIMGGRSHEATEKLFIIFLKHYLPISLSSLIGRFWYMSCSKFLFSFFKLKKKEVSFPSQLKWRQVKAGLNGAHIIHVF